jgi:hypothetical protein
MTTHYQAVYSPPRNSFGTHRKAGGPDARPIPLGISSFPEMIAGNYLYIDKTKLIRRLIKHYRFCFLYRPRRFGKTLLLDTLRHIFKGRSDLFRRLWLGSVKHEWKTHPIISLDLKVENPGQATEATLRHSLCQQLKLCADEYGLRLRGDNPPAAFEWLIDALQTKYGQGVVILIDDYDSPLTSAFPNPDLAQKNKDLLASLLSKLRALLFCLRFVMLAGEQRFPDRYLYPGVRRPFDLSYTKFFASLCGVTPFELDKHCYEHMVAATDSLKAQGRFGADRDVLDFRRAILYNYNGYSFDGQTRVLNPHTLMHVLKLHSFDDQGFNLAPPGEQIRLIRENGLAHDLFSSHHFVSRVNNFVSVDQRTVFPYLLQTGYLTLRRKRAMESGSNFLLRIPSHDIRRRLFLHLLAEGRKPGTIAILKGRMDIIYKALQSLSVPAMETAFKLLLASLRKPMFQSERDYFCQDLFLAMRMLFQAMDLDDPRTDGIIDGAIEFPGGDVFIVELRSADREWITLEKEPFKDGNRKFIVWPWHLPAQPRRLEPEEKADPFWVELNTLLDLQAQMAVQVIEDKQYPERFFPYIGTVTKVFKVGVAVYQRLKARVIVDEAMRKPKKLSQGDNMTTEKKPCYIQK